VCSKLSTFGTRTMADAEDVAFRAELMITFYHEAVEHLTRIHGAAKAFKGGADTFEYDTPSGHLVRPIEQVIKDEVCFPAQPTSAVSSASAARFRWHGRFPNPDVSAPSGVTGRTTPLECHLTDAGTCSQGISSDSRSERCRRGACSAATSSSSKNFAHSCELTTAQLSRSIPVQAASDVEVPAKQILMQPSMSREEKHILLEAFCVDPCDEVRGLLKELHAFVRYFRGWVQEKVRMLPHIGGGVRAARLNSSTCGFTCLAA